MNDFLITIRRMVYISIFCQGIQLLYLLVTLIKHSQINFFINLSLVLFCLLIYEGELLRKLKDKIFLFVSIVHIIFTFIMLCLYELIPLQLFQEIFLSNLYLLLSQLVTIILYVIIRINMIEKVNPFADQPKLVQAQEYIASFSYINASEKDIDKLNEAIMTVLDAMGEEEKTALGEQAAVLSTIIAASIQNGIYIQMDNKLINISTDLDRTRKE